MEMIESLLKPRNGYFDSEKIHIIDCLHINECDLFIYSVTKPFAIGAMLVDQYDARVLWRTTNPLWYTWEIVKSASVQYANGQFIFYIDFSDHKEVIKLTTAEMFGVDKSQTNPILERSQNNPIMKPIAEQPWQACSVYNTAAIFLNNKVHFIYRALSHDGISVFCYATSADGVHVDDQHGKPVFTAHNALARQGKYDGEICYSSGGSWCGCEDPRLVNIDNVIYMTYTAYDGISPPCMCLTSIKTEDFLQKRWRWNRSVQLSPLGQIHKNWVLFPEKLHGQYALLHSLTPKILIDYFDNLHFSAIPHIRSEYKSRSDDIYWDNWLRGIGPPPIKTKEGWLMIYHATDNRADPDKYKVGAMIVSEADPRKILFRTAQPLLEPLEIYETNGLKPGVIYTCGAVVIKDTLFIYYGAADTVICVASAKLDVFLERIKKSQPKCNLSKITL